ncbi:hypothetical protein [Paracoccus sp. (in: a-proteobacteria)]|uniref:hypothetical protein n=1 Tax=Paracoccus sp. TaxID=267 RepID=UPI003A8759B6
MMIFWRRALVMFSIPKTGSHSYIEHLQDQADVVFRHPQQLKHMGLTKFTSKIRPLFQQVGKPLDHFAYFREPVDWVWSWYRYRTRPEIRDRDASTHGISFDQFVDAVVADAPPPFALIGRQSHLVTSNAAPFVIDHIFRYDNATQANEYLSDKLGKKVCPPQRLNVSPEMPKEISRKTIAKLENALTREFEIYESAR